jgi:membrane protein
MVEPQAQVRLRGNGIGVMNRLSWLGNFFHQQLWEAEWHDLRRHLVNALRILILAGRGLFRNRALIRASSLAYATILGLIPLMALLFALMQGLGLPRLFAALFLERLAPGSREFALQILAYIESTKVTSLGVFGVVVLLGDLVIVMTGVERAFNHIWRAPRIRTWGRRVSDYLSIFIIFPILMALAVSISTSFLAAPAIRHVLEGIMPAVFYSATRWLVSLGILWVAFVFIYLVMPNARVHFSSALVGGIVGGTIWQLAQWIFTIMQGASTYYNAVYGALYNLLFLFVWIFWSWLILLFGAEVAFAYQNLDELKREFRRPRLLHEPVDDYLALAALAAIGLRFYHHRPPLSLAELTQLFHNRESLAANVVAALKESGLVVQVAGVEADGIPRYLPGLPLEQITIREALERLRLFRGAAVASVLAGDPRLQDTIKHLLETAPEAPWQSLSLKELVHLTEEAASRQA